MNRREFLKASTVAAAGLEPAQSRQWASDARSHAATFAPIVTRGLLYKAVMPDTLALPSAHSSVGGDVGQ